VKQDKDIMIADLACCTFQQPGFGFISMHTGIMAITALAVKGGLANCCRTLSDG